ncbi:hypothetical protein SARC_07747 [Sphaeroforma arctica JP610]|uniref:Uncharacterized protein n=1 Tax=Sphaeroforma arctica JP610 TaxID=667725 RepID=A0A0L0FVA8_9EUKA|nr:hypothetical protein SARC_07747 [Sphaeroforma arctica JP610]KNC79878.1 hypothetical protein SARC_07747 [Sphaeroforma arctica JP610]|eukprot:XP_014153780.1 hypothetical protein SARC_07747 [Sphaeroforma arctica JP610]
MSSSLNLPTVAKNPIKRASEHAPFDHKNINECVGHLRQSVDDVLQVASLVFAHNMTDHYSIQPTAPPPEGAAQAASASIEHSLIEFEEMCDNVYTLVLQTRNRLLARINDDYGLGYDVSANSPAQAPPTSVKKEAGATSTTDDKIMADDKYLAYCATILSQVTSTMVVIDKLTEFVNNTT